jgi:microcin C transport system substrate-binding protein
MRYNFFTLSFLSPLFLALSLWVYLQASSAHALEKKLLPQKTLSMQASAEAEKDFLSFSYANPKSIKGGELRQAVVGSFDTVNPFTLKGKAAQGLHLVYDRLMYRGWDQPFTLYPLIAETVVVPEDRSFITFHLNPKARFHDGSPITTEDVQFTFETLREKGRANMRQVYKLVDRIEVHSPQSITFHLNDQRDRESVMIVAMMPVLSQKDWQGKEFDQTLLTPPLASGPYKIEKIDAGREIRLKRIEDYWAKDLPVAKGQFNFDRIIYSYFRDDTVAQEALKKGDLNYRQEFDPANWLVFRRTLNKNSPLQMREIDHDRVERMWGFIFNTRRPPFDDIHVRKALSLMMDRDWINRSLFAGQYKTTTSYFENSDLQARGLPSPDDIAFFNSYRDELPLSIYETAWQAPATGSENSMRENRKKAEELLQKAGWIIQDNKRVSKKTGQELRFEILVGSLQDEKIALSFQRALKKLGVEVRLRNLDSSAFRDRLMRYDFDMTIYFWQNSLSPGTEQALYWGCQAREELGRFNYAGICKKSVDTLIKQIPNAQTRDDLRRLTSRLDRILTHGYYAIPLFYTGRDLILHNESLIPPPQPALYGNVLESWSQK